MVQVASHQRLNYIVADPPLRRSIEMIKDEDIRRTVKELDEHIRKEYMESHPKEKEERGTGGHTSNSSPRG